LENKIKQLESEVKKLNQIIESQQNSNANLLKEIQAREMLIQSYQNSRSWRLTKPVRVISMSARKFFKVFLKKIIVNINSKPRLKAIIISGVNKLGIFNSVREIYRRNSSHQINYKPQYIQSRNIENKFVDEEAKLFYEDLIIALAKKNINL
jgi:TolA-binding protein